MYWQVLRPRRTAGQTSRPAYRRLRVHDRDPLQNWAHILEPDNIGGSLIDLHRWDGISRGARIRSSTPRAVGKSLQAYRGNGHNLIGTSANRFSAHGRRKGLSGHRLGLLTSFQAVHRAVGRSILPCRLPGGALLLELMVALSSAHRCRRLACCGCYVTDTYFCYY